MSAYLLSCECGNNVTVEVGQAGGQVTCRCGKTLDVPALRQLRHLPQARVDEARPTSNWGLRQGFVTACVIAVLGLLVAIGWNWWNAPTIPKFDPVHRQQIVEEQLKTPASAWQSWVGFYKPLAASGLRFFYRSDTHTILETLEVRARHRKMLWALTGIFAVAAAAGIFWPAAGKTGRPGDRETRRQ
jgi:hypothetical protein